MSKYNKIRIKTINKKNDNKWNKNENEIKHEGRRIIYKVTIRK